MAWDQEDGSGDVTGPASSTDNAVPRYASTTGKILQNSGLIIDDSNAITGGAKMTLTEASSGGTPSTEGDNLVVENSGNTGITILSGTSSTAAIYFGDSGDSDIGRVTYTNSDNALNFYSNNTKNMNITSSGDVNIKNTAATSGRNLNISESGATTEVNMQFTNGSSGTGPANGTLAGLNGDATPDFEIVNFEASDILLKTANISAAALNSDQNFSQYGGNPTNGGNVDLTNVTTGTGSSATFDALRFLDYSGAVITGPLSGFVYISMVDGADVKTIQYRYLNTGDGVTNQVANLADQAQTGTNPWTSTAVVADGSGVKIQLTTSASRTSVTTICRFIGVRGING